MKKKLLTMLLAVMLLASVLVPAAGAAGSVSLVAYNPLGDVQVQDNVPLTDRSKFTNAAGDFDLTGLNIGISSYSKSRNANALAGLAELIRADFPGANVITTTALGNAWNNKTDANYNLWAGRTALTGANAGRYLDATIFGVLD